MATIPQSVKEYLESSEHTKGKSAEEIWENMSPQEQANFVYAVERSLKEAEEKALWERELAAKGTAATVDTRFQDFLRDARIKAAELGASQAFESYLSSRGESITQQEIEAWLTNEQDKAFIRASRETDMGDLRRETIQGIRGSTNLRKAETLSKNVETGTKIAGSIGKGFGMPMTKQNRQDLYFGTASKDLYSPRTPSVEPLRSGASKQGLDLSALRKASEPSSLRKPSLNLERLREAPKRQETMVRTMSTEVPEPSNLKPGEEIVEQIKTPVYFWIGSNKGWETGLSNSVFISKMSTGVYRFVGFGSKTGKARSKIIGKSLDNADIIAVKRGK